MADVANVARQRVQRRQHLRFRVDRPYHGHDRIVETRYREPPRLARAQPRHDLGVRAGGGLAKSWSQRLRINGKPCNLGLGRYPIVTLAEARDKALENARAVAQGSEPRDRSRVPTFKQAATGTRSAGSGRRSRSASGSSGARPTWTASERSGPW